MLRYCFIRNVKVIPNHLIWLACNEKFNNFRFSGCKFILFTIVYKVEIFRNSFIRLYSLRFRKD